MTSTQFSGPWLPWFHGDFLRATQGWTVTERGVYFLLLGASWEMGPLPDDRRRLAGIVGAQLDEFDEAWKTVRPKFVRTKDGLLINRRLELHRDKQALRSEKARQSVMNRWQGKLELDTSVDTNADTNVDTSVGTFDDTSGDTNGYTNGHTLGIRSGYSSELRDQISEKDKSSTRRSIVPAVFHDQVKAAFHRLCPNLPGIKSWPKHRKAALESRIRERCADGKPADTLPYWESFFESVAASDFLSGRTENPFHPNIDWLLGPKNFCKVIEGNYVNRKSNGAHPHG
jgi:uncharacterized protein YdaU (DUF1376 family)